MRHAGMLPRQTVVLMPSLATLMRPLNSKFSHRLRYHCLTSS